MRASATRRSTAACTLSPRFIPFSPPVCEWNGLPAPNPLDRHRAPNRNPPHPLRYSPRLAHPRRIIEGCRVAIHAARYDPSAGAAVADPTQADIDAAQADDLNGVTLVKHGDKTVQYDADARAASIEKYQRRISKRAHVGFAKCGKGN